MDREIDTLILSGPVDLGTVLTRSGTISSRRAGSNPAGSLDPGELRDRIAEIRGEVVATSPGDSSNIRRAPEVFSAAPNFIFSLVESGSSTDSGAVMDVPPLGGASWGIERIGAMGGDLSWGRGCTVAVLDTGLTDHPAFAGVAIERRNFAGALPGGEADPDVIGHGTHCAGTILGRDTGGVQIGVARGVERLLAGKVLGGRQAVSASISKGFLWALVSQAHVVSMSIQMDFASYRQHLVERKGFHDKAATAIALEAYRENLKLFDDLSQLTENAAFPTIVVVASGNLSKRPEYTIPCAPPAIGEQFISVAATKDDDSIWEQSNTMPTLSAPGAGIWSASLEGGLRIDSGSSMAAPHVAGIAAVLVARSLARDGSIRAAEIRQQITGRAKRLAGRTEDFGQGLAQVE